MPLTDAEQLRAQLSRDEGRVPHAYQDTLGFWTIGVGHLIDVDKGGKLPEFIIDLLLDYDIKKHADELFAAQPWVKDLDPARQGVLINMAFNLGIEPFDEDGFKDWPMFLSQVKAGQFEKAAENMLSTKWAGQVGARAVRLATQMITGVWQ